MSRAERQLPAVFFDKDGTLVRDVPYNVDPQRIELMPGAGEGAAQLAAAGYAIVVVSNQSGIARGLFPEHALEQVGQRLRELLADYYVPLAGFYYCPHHPQGVVTEYTVNCECRKPLPGMILQAARDLSLDLSRSWMVGDILDDVEAGHRAGCQAALIDNGHETEWCWNSRRRPDLVAVDLAVAAQHILAAATKIPPALELVP